FMYHPSCRTSDFIPTQPILPPTTSGTATHTSSCRAARPEPELCQHRGRRAVEALERHVADVTEVLAADRARVEAARGQIPIQREELRRLAQRRAGARRAADVVADRALRRLLERGKIPAEAPLRLLVQPHEPAEYHAAIAHEVGI